MHPGNRNWELLQWVINLVHFASKPDNMAIEGTWYWLQATLDYACFYFTKNKYKILPLIGSEDDHCQIPYRKLEIKDLIWNSLKLLFLETTRGTCHTSGRKATCSSWHSIFIVARLSWCPGEGHHHERSSSMHSWRSQAPSSLLQHSALAPLFFTNIKVICLLRLLSPTV